MSRTYHHNNHKTFKRRLVKGSYYKKLCHILGEDFATKKGKQRRINRTARAKQKQLLKKEVSNEINFVSHQSFAVWWN